MNDDYAPPVAALDNVRAAARAVVQEWQDQPGVVHSSMLSSAIEDLANTLKVYDHLHQDDEDETTSLEMLADYECPECGRMDDPVRGFAYTEDEASDVLVGDEQGNLVCPECGEELEQTAEAAADHLAFIAEQMAKATDNPSRAVGES